MILHLSWLAVATLSVSYWLQIWRIHVHKEVRDLSMPYHILLAIGFGILTITAYMEDSTVFLVKQIMTTIPVLIIIGQIIYHKKDRWHDKDTKNCCNCGYELENYWTYCPNCGMVVE